MRRNCGLSLGVPYWGCLFPLIHCRVCGSLYLGIHSVGTLLLGESLHLLGVGDCCSSHVPGFLRDFIARVFSLQACEDV